MKFSTVYNYTPTLLRVAQKSNLAENAGKIRGLQLYPNTPRSKASPEYHFYEIKCGLQLYPNTLAFGTQKYTFCNPKCIKIKLHSG
jgi:hypothetical protein